MFGFKKKQPEKFVESAGATVSVEEEGFTKLTGDKDRSLSSLTQERMQELAVFLWKSNPLANRIIVPGDESFFGEEAQKLRESYTDGDCFYFNVNALSSSSRGLSDLLPTMDWLDLYDKALFGEVERWDALRAFIWDVTLHGATEETVRKRAAEIEVPDSGGVRVHNDGETWNAVTPDLQAANGAENARTVRNHIMGGATLPEHWYGGGGDVNRSTAGEMGEPTFKTFKFRQTTWKHILETVCFYAIYSRMEKIGAIPPDLRDYRPAAQFPELTHRDTSVYAAALQQTVVAVGIAVEKGMMTEETAIATVAAMLNRIGIEIDPADELERARKIAKEQSGEDLYDEQSV